MIADPKKAKNEMEARALIIDQAFPPGSEALLIESAGTCGGIFSTLQPS
ncbi:hypothetical protein [Pseudorhizobium flavum]